MAHMDLYEDKTPEEKRALVQAEIHPLTGQPKTDAHTIKAAIGRKGGYTRRWNLGMYQDRAWMEAQQAQWDAVIKLVKDEW